jgi:Xaa-Pro dipeptidase
MSTTLIRRERAMSLMSKAGLDACAFVPGSNFKYLTDVTLHLMERPTLFVLTAQGTSHAIMPALEQHKWSSAMPQTSTHYWADEDGPGTAFANLRSELGNVVLGIEGLLMRAAELMLLRSHWTEEAIRDSDTALTDLRISKEPDEISALRRAIAISETALLDTLADSRAGQTEAVILARLKQAMLHHGAQGFAFDPVVLSGSQAANPHGSPGDRAIAPGEALLIDFGASHDGMNADITRTFFCEHVSDAHATIYDAVLRANAAGKASAAPGIPVEVVDRAATEVLQNAGFSNLILHKTGHGLGRDVHEAPQVMRGNIKPLASGMVITIEPGLYLEGEIGVRIEDDVLITDSGMESLTTFDRELTTFG